jgi:hypothetical protein
MALKGIQKNLWHIRNSSKFLWHRENLLKKEWKQNGQRPYNKVGCILGWAILVIGHISSFGS